MANKQVFGVMTPFDNGGDPMKCCSWCLSGLFYSRRIAAKFALEEYGVRKSQGGPFPLQPCRICKPTQQEIDTYLTVSGRSIQD